MPRVLVLSDIHVPYHDKEALVTALKYGKAWEADTIVLLGDTLDFYQISRFSKDPRKHSVLDELKLAAKELGRIRRMFPRARVIFYRGNHELRLEHYINDNACKIAPLIGNLLSQHLNMHELAIEYKTEPFMIGQLLFLHGHELVGRGGVNIPDTLWKQLTCSCICGHFHRSQSKTFKNYHGQRFWCGSVGYLGGPQDYAPINNWATGFATVEVKKDGKFKATLHEIIDGEVV